MQWLLRSRALWGIHTSCRGFRSAPQYLHYQSLSGAGTPRWSDDYNPKEFNFARDVFDYWTQMEKVRQPL